MNTERTQKLPAEKEQQHERENLGEEKSPKEKEEHFPFSDEASIHGVAEWEQEEADSADDQAPLPSEALALPAEDQPFIAEHPFSASLQEQQAPSPQTCQDILSQDPVCCLPGDPVDMVARLMQTEDIGSLPVVEDLQHPKLVGIVTDRDLVLRVLAEGQDPKNVTAGEVMTRNPMSCRAEDDIHVALNMMAEQQVRRLPVVDEQGLLVGIIAQADVATRVGQRDTTAEVVKEISQPSTGGGGQTERRRENRTRTRSPQRKPQRTMRTKPRARTEGSAGGKKTSARGKTTKRTAARQTVRKEEKSTAARRSTAKSASTKKAVQTRVRKPKAQSAKKIKSKKR